MKINFFIFGKKCHVVLAQARMFGSRVDDDQRGGDIDLYIEPEIQWASQLVDAKLSFLLRMHRILGEQKIDVVLNRSESGMVLPIYNIAKDTGELLL